MGARFVRAVTFAALFVVLPMGMRAFAGYTAEVRLDSSRIFNPESESLLAPFDGEARLSWLSQSVFNVSVSAFAQEGIADLLVPPPQTEPSAGVNLNGIDRVRTYVPQTHASYMPPPAINPPQNDALTAPSQAAPPSVASLSSIAPPAFPRVHFGTYTEYTPAVQSLAANVSVPMRVGALHFNGTMSGSGNQSQQSDAFRAMQNCGTTDENAACPYLRDTGAQSLVVGTNFNVRAGNDNVNLALSSSVSHVSTGDAAIFPYVPVDPDAQISSDFNSAGPDASALQYAGLSDVVKHGVGAALAVPVTSRITLGLQYDRSHYQGDYYGNSLLPGLDAYKDTYLGNVTYQVPNTNSMVTLSARQYRYQDSLSNFNLTQTRADLDFTVKF